MVAAMPFIRDDSNDQQYVDRWNNAKPHARGKLLKAAGLSVSSYQYRAWAFVPYFIRVDVVAVIKREERASKKAAASKLNVTQHPANTAKTTKPPFWWQDSEKEPENV